MRRIEPWKCKGKKIVDRDVDHDVEFLATYSIPCLPACHPDSCHADNRLNLWIVIQLQLNVFLYKCCCGTGVSSQK